VVLVVLAVAVLGWLSWRLVRKVLALGGELGRSADRVGPVMDQLQEPYRPAASVLSDPDPAARDRPARAGHRRFPAARGAGARGRVG